MEVSRTHSEKTFLNQINPFLEHQANQNKPVTHQIKTTLEKLAIQQTMKKASLHFPRELTTKNSNRSLEPVKQAEVTVKFRKIVTWRARIRYNLPCLKFSVTVSKEFLTAPSKQVTQFLIRIVWELECSNRQTLSCIRAITIPVSVTKIAWVLVIQL